MELMKNGMVRMLRLVKLIRYLPFARKEIYRKAVSLLKDSTRVVSCLNSIKIKVDLLEEIGTHVFLYGVWEPVNTKFFIQLLKPGMICYDIGANIGYYTLIFARAVGESGSVLSFEPISSVRKSLVENVVLNNYSHIVKVIDTALSDTESEIEMYLGDASNMGTSSFARPKNFSGKSETVKTLLLDNLIKRDNLYKLPDVLKIDVEGAELKVLRGMNTLLSTNSIDIFVEIHDWTLKKQGDSAKQVFDYLASLSYKGYLIRRKGLIPIDKNIPQKESLVYFTKLSVRKRYL